MFNDPNPLHPFTLERMWMNSLPAGLIIIALLIVLLIWGIVPALRPRRLPTILAYFVSSLIPLLVGMYFTIGLIATGLFNAAYPSGIGDQVSILRVIGDALVPFALGTSGTIFSLCVTILLLLFGNPSAGQGIPPNDHAP
jgi:hypothetical protein